MPVSLKHTNSVTCPSRTGWYFFGFNLSSPRQSVVPSKSSFWSFIKPSCLFQDGISRVLGKLVQGSLCSSYDNFDSSVNFFLDAVVWTCCVSAIATPAKLPGWFLERKLFSSFFCPTWMRDAWKFSPSCFTLCYVVDSCIVDTHHRARVTLQVFIIVVCYIFQKYDQSQPNYGPSTPLTRQPAGDLGSLCVFSSCPRGYWLLAWGNERFSRCL